MFNVSRALSEPGLFAEFAFDASSDGLARKALPARLGPLAFLRLVADENRALFCPEDDAGSLRLRKSVCAARATA